MLVRRTASLVNLCIAFSSTLFLPITQLSGVDGGVFLCIFAYLLSKRVALDGNSFAQSDVSAHGRSFVGLTILKGVCKEAGKAWEKLESQARG